MIVVFADHDLGVLDPLSLQAVTAAKALDADVQVLVVGADGRSTADELGAYGATIVHLAVHDALTDYTPLAAARAAQQLVSELSPQAVISAGTPRGNEVLAHLAALLDVPMSADTVSLTLSTTGDHQVVRNRWGGNLLETATRNNIHTLKHPLLHGQEPEPPLYQLF